MNVGENYGDEFVLWIQIKKRKRKNNKKEKTKTRNKKGKEKKKKRARKGKRRQHNGENEETTRRGEKGARINVIYIKRKKHRFVENNTSAKFKIIVFTTPIVWWCKLLGLELRFFEHLKAPRGRPDPRKT